MTETESHKAEIRQQIADYHNCDLSEIVGKVSDLLEEVEGFGVNVYWGAIPDEILNSNF